MLPLHTRLQYVFYVRCYLYIQDCSMYSMLDVSSTYKTAVCILCHTVYICILCLLYIYMCVLCLLYICVFYVLLYIYVFYIYCIYVYSMFYCMYSMFYCIYIYIYVFNVLLYIHVFSVYCLLFAVYINLNGYPDIHAYRHARCRRHQETRLLCLSRLSGTLPQGGSATVQARSPAAR